MTTSGLNEATVKKLAALARLAINDDEVRALVPELARIVHHVDSMRMIDTTGVMPMTHGHPAGAVLHVPAPIAAADAEADAAVLGRAAIDQSQGYDDADGTISVPKVIE